MASARDAHRCKDCSIFAALAQCISVNPDVWQTTIDRTICVSGYSRSVRPSSTYTRGVKTKLLREAGEDESRAGDYQLDHIIPLSVGGHPRKLSNLLLQPLSGENSALRKDRLEARLHSLVCHRELALDEARRCIAEDWQACAEGRRARPNSQPLGIASTPKDAPTREDDSICLIKGNINRAGEHIYHLPGDSNYYATVIDPTAGERMFCTAQEAESAGWRAPRRQAPPPFEN